MQKVERVSTFLVFKLERFMFSLSEKRFVPYYSQDKSLICPLVSYRLYTLMHKPVSLVSAEHSCLQTSSKPQIRWSSPSPGIMEGREAELGLFDQHLILPLVARESQPLRSPKATERQKETEILTPHLHRGVFWMRNFKTAYEATLIFLGKMPLSTSTQNVSKRMSQCEL